MIQVILKDGTPMRFTEQVVGLKPEDIVYQKELTEEEIKLRPIKVDGKIIYIDNKELLLNNWSKEK